MTYPELLRELATLIEDNNLIPPSRIDEDCIGVHSYGESAAADLAAWRRALGGTWNKEGFDTFICMDSKAENLPGAPTIELFIQKDRCTRTVVGTKEVTIPAVEARPEHTKTVEIVEWDCEPVLAAL